MYNRCLSVWVCVGVCVHYVSCVAFAPRSLHFVCLACLKCRENVAKRKLKNPMWNWIMSLSVCRGGGSKKERRKPASAAAAVGVDVEVAVVVAFVVTVLCGMFVMWQEDLCIVQRVVQFALIVPHKDLFGTLSRCATADSCCNGRCHIWAKQTAKLFLHNFNWISLIKI